MIDFQNTTYLHDERVNCVSFMTAMRVEDYLSMVEEAYVNRGGLEHQREPLKTTTAKRIRKRMVDDILKGAVLPPVVIGKVVENICEYSNEKAIQSLLNSGAREDLSIIDGMQRTTALHEAQSQDPNTVKDKTIRVEFWIAESTESLIYRMLVLNTGQVPWNLSKQLQVVYAPLVAEMKAKVNFERVLNLLAGERRTRAGQYRPDDLAELYIAFGLRKTDIDTQETLADEFSRLDMAEALSSHLYRKFFYPTIQMLVDLDKAFSRLDDQLTAQAEGEEATAPKVKIGRSIFDSKPARVGFVVAVATSILGRIGMEHDEDSVEIKLRLESLLGGVELIIEKLDKMTAEEISDFLRLGVLSERLYGQKRSAVGRYERAFFDNAFKILIDEGFNVPSLEPCWRG